MNNNISFKSNIKFITSQEFHKNKNKGYYIGYQHYCPNILKADKFFSTEIRTCTGGGIIDKNGEAIGFHIWDDKKNSHNFHEIIAKMFRYINNPERGLLIGSKDLKSNPYSLKLFKKFKERFSQRIENLSLFEKHKYPKSETNYAYSKNDDTWLICTNYITKDNNFKNIKSIDDLKEAFETIKIAKGDKLFIGKKEITPKESPEFFEK